MEIEIATLFILINGGTHVAIYGAACPNLPPASAEDFQQQDHRW